LPVLPLLAYIAPINYLVAIVGSILGLLTSFRFYYYYFLTRGVDWAAPFLTQFQLPAWVLPSCKLTSGCANQLFEDWFGQLSLATYGHMVFDALSIHVACVVFILIECLRYKISVPISLLYVILTTFLGFDAVVPIFFLHLQSLEIRYAKEDKMKTKTAVGTFHWLYLLLCVVSVIIWAKVMHDRMFVYHTSPATLVQEGLWTTVAGFRTTAPILYSFFSLSPHLLPYIQSNSQGFVGFLTTWMLRLILWNILLTHIGAGVLLFFLYRELAKDHTFIYYFVSKPDSGKKKK